MSVEVVSSLAGDGRLLDVFEYFPAFIVVIHANDHRVAYCNHMARLVFGDDRLGESYDSFFNSNDLSERYFKQASEQRNGTYDGMINGKWYNISNTAAVWLDGIPSRLLVGFDITNIKTSPRRTSVTATLDLMTGISNRQTGLDYLEFYLQEVRNYGITVTVCYIDINDLKHVNDSSGHAQGDEYIKSVVSCIRSSVRRTDVFARMGGDEFLLIFPNCRHDIVENIMDIVTNKLNFINESESKSYSISYGIMEVNTETKLDMEYILNAADSKMYYMKDEYRRRRGTL